MCRIFFRVLSWGNFVQGDKSNCDVLYCVPVAPFEGN